MVSLNERLTSLEIVRQVLLLRYSMHVRMMVIDALNDTEEPVARMVRDALATDAGMRNPASVQQLDNLIVQINAIRDTAWRTGAQQVAQAMQDLVAIQPEEQRHIFEVFLPAVQLVAPVGVAFTALTVPFQGRTLRQWFADAQADDAKRIKSALYLAASTGESSATAARRIVGTARAIGRDGTTQTSRNHIDTIVRSATVHFDAYARDQFYRANATADSLAAGGRKQDLLFTREQFIAVLDNSTTQVCRGFDGRTFRIGEGPLPPLHLNCRSMRVLVLPLLVGGPTYDPGKFGAWVRRQPLDVKIMLLGRARMARKEVADAAFKDYGAKPMTLAQIQEESRRLMVAY